MQSLFLVMLGGAFGSGARYLFGRWTLDAFGPGFPWGTLGVNLIGGLLMGVLAGLLARSVPESGETARVLVGVGVLGGFTTFSAFSLDTVLLFERGDWGLAFAYILASVIGAILALAVGLAAVRAVA